LAETTEMGLAVAGDAVTPDGSIRVKKLAGALGAEITGVSLRDLSDEQFAVIHAACLEHCVLVFPGQYLDPGGQVAFGRRWGDMRTAPWLESAPGRPEIQVAVTQGKGGAITELWHSDGAFEEHPPSFTLLNAITLPAWGGDTVWANQYLAYERLPDDLRQRVDTLRAVHAGFGREATHPVVRVHPETGKKSLFISQPATRYFEGSTPRRSYPLLKHLLEHATALDVTFRHRWSEGDLVMWDNRCLIHFAIRDYGEQIRVMHRAVVN